MLINISLVDCFEEHTMLVNTTSGCADTARAGSILSAHWFYWCVILGCNVVVASFGLFLGNFVASLASRFQPYHNTASASSTPSPPPP